MVDESSMPLLAPVCLLHWMSELQGRVRIMKQVQCFVPSFPPCTNKNRLYRPPKDDHPLEPETWFGFRWLLYMRRTILFPLNPGFRSAWGRHQPLNWGVGGGGGGGWGGGGRGWGETTTSLPNFLELGCFVFFVGGGGVGG